MPSLTPGRKGRRCTAHAKNSGKQCTQWAIGGGNVCRMHGGGAPQVKAKARERLLALVDPAIVALSQIVKDKEHAQRLAAAREILTRAGVGEAEQAQVEGLLTYEQLEMIVRAKRITRVEAE